MSLLIVLFHKVGDMGQADVVDNASCIVAFVSRLCDSF